MFKRLMMLLFTVLLLSGLMACQSQTPEATPAQPTPLPTLVPTATPVVATSTPLPTDTTSPDLQATPSPTAESGETRLSPTPTVAWQIPEVQSDDWVKGGDGAGLVIVEYGDFQ